MKFLGLMILMPSKMHAFLLKKYSREMMMYTGQMDLVMDDDALDNNIPVMCANIEVLRSRNISVP